MASDRTFHLAFSNTFTASQDEIQMFELPDKIMQRLKTGEQIYLSAEEGEDAVLITENETFALKKAETTNSLFITPPVEPDPDEPTAKRIRRTVVASLGHVYELVPTPPKLSKLKTMLQELPYRGPAPSDSAQQVDAHLHLYTMEQLLNSVQASESEIRAYLKELKAVELHGFVRVLHPDYEDAILHSIMLTITSEGYDASALSERDMCTQVDEPAECVRHILGVYSRNSAGEPVITTDERTGDRVIALNPDRLCRWNAQRLLFVTSAEYWLYDTFMQSWADSCDPFIPHESLLVGLAIDEYMGPERRLRPVNLDLLPVSPGQRFRALFALRSRWLLADLKPFIVDIVGTGQTQEQLLSRFTRLTDEDGVKYYSAK